MFSASLRHFYLNRYGQVWLGKERGSISVDGLYPHSNPLSAFLQSCTCVYTHKHVHVYVCVDPPLALL